jgi:hypothetical protein
MYRAHEARDIILIVSSFVVPLLKPIAIPALSKLQKARKKTVNKKHKPNNGSCLND